MASHNGLFISDFDMSAIKMHSILKLAECLICYFKKTDDSRAPRAIQFYNRVIAAEKKRHETGIIDDVLHNGKRMKMLAENIGGLPVGYLEMVKAEVKKSTMPSFNEAVSYALSAGIRPHIITMSFDYFLKDLSENWGSTYDSNHLDINYDDNRVKSAVITVCDEMSKADLIEKKIMDYIAEVGSSPEIHLHGDGESDIPMFERAISLKEMGYIKRLFIYVPENGTQHAIGIATDPYPIGHILERVEKNIRVS